MPSSNPGSWALVGQGAQQLQILDSKVTGVHAVLMHTGNILYFHMRYFPALSAYINPISIAPNSVAELVIPETQLTTYTTLPAMFCGAQIVMDDGKVLVAGGEIEPPPDLEAGLKITFIYDPDASSDRWIDTNHLMHHGRWYPTITGWVDSSDNIFKVIAMSGYDETGATNLNLIPEKYVPGTGSGTGWIEINDSNNYGQMPSDFRAFYPAGHVIPKGNHAGKIFYSMPPPQSYVFDPLGGGTGSEKYWKSYGSARNFQRYYGNSVLLPIKSGVSPKVLIIGGNIGDGAAYNDCLLIDLDDSGGAQNWQTLGNNLNYARVDQNSVLLPDQTILAVGGNSSGSTVGSILQAELLDVRDQANIVSSAAWVTMASANVPRNYHSSALLLPDASVLTLGGRLSSIDGTTDLPFAYDFESDLERRLEIYTPYYLTDGDRPTISSSPSTINYDNSGHTHDFQVTVDSHSPAWSIDSIVLIRPGSCTHSLDMEQRMIVLSFTQNHNTYTVRPPSDYNMALPGYYMLFVVLNKSQSTSGNSNIPSVSVFVKLEQ